jgi:predicted dehydrogenase
MEAVTPHGCVTMDDFVEVRTFGDPAQPAVETFPGLATRPVDRPWVDKLGERGLPGMLEVRRQLHRQWRQSGEPVPGVIPNFLRDQGWRNSIRQFVSCLACGIPLPHATLEDAATAAAISRAVEQSRATGRAVSPINRVSPQP